MTEPEIAALLAANGFGTINTNLFYDLLPTDPDIAMCVLGYGGSPDEPDGQSTRLESPRFQVLARGVRGASSGPKLRVLQARALLVSVLGQELTGVRDVSIDCLGPPFPQGADEQFRYVWSVNFEAMKDPSVT